MEQNGRTYKENAQRQASSVACKRIPWKPSHRKQTNRHPISHADSQ